MEIFDESMSAEYIRDQVKCCHPRLARLLWARKALCWSDNTSVFLGIALCPLVILVLVLAYKQFLVIEPILSYESFWVSVYASIAEAVIGLIFIPAWWWGCTLPAHLTYLFYQRAEKLYWQVMDVDNESLGLCARSVLDSWYEIREAFR